MSAIGSRLDVIHLVSQPPPPSERLLVLRAPSAQPAEPPSTSEEVSEPTDRAPVAASQAALELALTDGAPTPIADFLADEAVEVAVRAVRTITTMLDLSAALERGGVASIRLTTDNTEGRKVAPILAVVAKATGASFEVVDRDRLRGAAERLVYRPLPAVRLAATTARGGLDAFQARRAGARRRGAPPTSEHVILSSGRNAAPHLLPIARALWASGHAATVIATDPAAMGPASTSDGAPEGAVRYAWPVVLTPSQVRLLRDHAVAATLSHRESLGLCPATAHGLAAFVAADLVACYQRWVSVVRALDRLDLAPDAAGLTLYWASIEGRAFVGSFARRGLPTAAFAHGSLLTVARQPIVDHYFVWGDEMADSAHRTWGDEPPITVTGNPHEEEVLARRADTTSASGPPTILVAFGRPNVLLDESDFLAALRQVCDAARTLEGSLRFEVSVHPVDLSGHWEAMRAAFPGLIELVPKGQFYPRLHRSAGLVTMFSTAGSEAAFLGKPVFVSSPGHVVDRSQLAPRVVADEAAYLCLTADDLARQLRAVVLDGHDPLAENRARHAERFLHVDAEGRSSAEVIAAQMKEIRTEPGR